MRWDFTTQERHLNKHGIHNLNDCGVQYTVEIHYSDYKVIWHCALFDWPAQCVAGLCYVSTNLFALTVSYFTEFSVNAVVEEWGSCGVAQGCYLFECSHNIAVYTPVVKWNLDGWNRPDYCMFSELTFSLREKFVNRISDRTVIDLNHFAQLLHAFTFRL